MVTTYDACRVGEASYRPAPRSWAGQGGPDGQGQRPTGAAAWRPPSRTVVHSRPRATAPPRAGSKSRSGDTGVWVGWGGVGERKGEGPEEGRGWRRHVPTPPTQISVTRVGAEQLSCGRSDPRL